VTVEATHFGTMAIVIIGIALAVFVITAIGRAIRRGTRPPGGDEAGAGGAAADADGTAAAAGDGDETAAAEDGAAGPGPTEPDPAYTGPEADTVERERAGRPPAAKEPDEHASTPGWAERR
jgi:hypothetical protein